MTSEIILFQSRFVRKLHTTERNLTVFVSVRKIGALILEEVNV